MDSNGKGKTHRCGVPECGAAAAEGWAVMWILACWMDEWRTLRSENLGMRSFDHF